MAKAKRLQVVLPNDLIFMEILPKLPYKSLARFKCVSKAFNTQISTIEFITLIYRDGNRYYCSYLNLPDHDVELYIPDPRVLHYYGNENDTSKEYISFVGSCNGLICLSFLRWRIDMTTEFPHSYTWAYCHLLLNPLTRSYRQTVLDRHHKIPYLKFCVEHQVKYGFGFDSRVDDYKIVRISHYKNNPNDVEKFRQVSVYNLRDDSWRVVVSKEMWDGTSFTNGSCTVINNYLIHWMVRSEITTGEHRLVCFNLRDEVWVGDVSLSNACYNGKDHRELENRLHLGVLDGCLCLSIDKDLISDIWVMKHYRMKESWTKLAAISNHDVPPSLSIDLCRTITHTQIDSIHPSRKDISNFTSTSVFCKAPSNLEAYICILSLFSVPNGRKLETKQRTFHTPWYSSLLSVVLQMFE